MSNRSKTALLIFVDSLVLFFVLTLVAWARNKQANTISFIIDHYKLFIFFLPIWILVNFIEGLYTLRTYNPANLPISILRSTFLSVLMTFVGFYLIPQRYLVITPKITIVLLGIISMPLLHTWRKFFFNFFAKKNRQLVTLLIGSSSTLELVIDELVRKPYLGYRVIGAYAPEEALKHEVSPKTKLIAIERNLATNPELYTKYFSLLGSGVEVMDLAKFAEKISGKIPLSAINESWFIEYCGHNESRSYDIFKNIIDRVSAIIMIILVLPLFLLMVPILLIFHGRPLFFKQIRTGQGNKPFVLYKIRSMVTDAEKSGAQWSSPKDLRITKLGKLLRKSRFDELPQLINIFKGEMSLVGPRPERPEIIESQLAPNIAFYNLRHLVKPGVTGWAQVLFRYGYTQEDSAEKLQYDLYYIKNKSFWLDTVVIIKTIKTVLTGAGQ